MWKKKKIKGVCKAVFIYFFFFSFLKSILNSEWIVSISCVFSWKVPDAGGSRPPGDESETVNERQSVREGCSAGEGVLSVSGLPREEFFQATVPCLPLCYLRARTADGSGTCSRTLDIDVCKMWDLCSISQLTVHCMVLVETYLRI